MPAAQHAGRGIVVAAVRRRYSPRWPCCPRRSITLCCCRRSSRRRRRCAAARPCRCAGGGRAPCGRLPRLPRCRRLRGRRQSRERTRSCLGRRPAGVQDHAWRHDGGSSWRGGGGTAPRAHSPLLGDNVARCHDVLDEVCFALWLQACVGGHPAHLHAPEGEREEKGVGPQVAAVWQARRKAARELLVDAPALAHQRRPRLGHSTRPPIKFRPHFPPFVKLFLFFPLAVHAPCHRAAHAAQAPCAPRILKSEQK